MSKALVQSQFGTHAAKYATSDVHAKGESLGRLVELVAPEAHWHALDVATGAGHTALAFAPHVGRVTASDLTDQMLAQAAKLAADKGFANMDTAKADAEALPFADASFDLVTCRLAAHHFLNVAGFVAEAARVLKPGGIFALVDNISPDAEALPHLEAAQIAAVETAYNAFEKLRDPSHGHALTLAQWRDLVTANGFEIVACERMLKGLDFEAYAERLACSAETTEELRRRLYADPTGLTAFLQPHEIDGVLWFMLHEGILVARKRA